MIQPIFNQLKLVVTAFVLTMGIVSSLSMGSISTQAAPVYSCPAGSVLVGTSCQSFACADNSVPVSGNCAANQYGLYECKTAPAGATRVLLPYYQVSYGGGLCTTKPDLFRMGSCNAGGAWPEGNQSTGPTAGNTSYSTNGKYWWDPAISAGTQWVYTHGNGTQGIQPLGRSGMTYGVGANFSAYIANNNWKPLINPYLDPKVYGNNGQNYENVVNAFNQDVLQNNMCTQYKIVNVVCAIPSGGAGGCNQYKYTFERSGNYRACDPGYGVYMRPTNLGHSIDTTFGSGEASIVDDVWTRGITSLCMKYGTPTAGLQSIAYSTGYRPKSCNSIGLVEVYATDLGGGDQEADTLCIPSSPQPASVVGKTVTTPATLTSNSPEGWLDGISNTGVASGWATDADVPNTSLDVHFYIDGSTTSMGTYIGKTTASYVRPDLPAPYNTGKNGYDFKIPEAYCDSKPHTLYAYGIDAPAFVSNPLLSGSPKSFTLSPTECGYGTTTTTTVAKDPITLTDLTNGSTKIICNGGKEVIVNSKTTCIFDIGDKILPDNTNISIGNGDISSSTCKAVGAAVNCTNVSTGTLTGDQPIMVKIGNGVKTDTNQKVKVVAVAVVTPVTTTTVVTTDDFNPKTDNGSGASNGSTIKIICNDGKDVAMNSTATCTFDIGNKTLPENTKIAIGNGDINTSTCTANGSKVTCTNVSTGSEAGDQPLYIKIGNGQKVNTNQKVKVSGDSSVTATLVRSGAGTAVAGTIGTMAMAGAGFFFYKKKTSRNAKLNI